MKIKTEFWGYKLWLEYFHFPCGAQTPTMRRVCKRNALESNCDPIAIKFAAVATPEGPLGMQAGPQAECV